MPDTEIELIDKNCLISELRSCNSNSPCKKEVIILDCRSANDYAASHIKQSANISIPTIMLRRLKEGKIDLFSTIKCKDLKNRILGMDIQTLFVLYHNSPAQSSPDIMQILSRKLMAEFNDKKIRVVCLAGEFRSTNVHLFTSSSFIRCPSSPPPHSRLDFHSEAENFHS
jgi:rhodanese-related sulfurtransferase